jgi:peptidoglycan/xylan/chitin deacetylase (PgdA/CDA1 family)
LAAADVLAPGRLSILIFHRVLPQPDPIFPGEMHAARFDHLMALVARAFRVMTLGEAVAARDAGRLPLRALVITFDDGYADNAEIALPLLRRYGLKATFFVASGFLDGGRMFNDTVIESIRAAAAKRIDLGDWGLGARTLDGPDERRSVIEALLPRVKYLPLGEREHFLSRLLQLTGHPHLPADLMMRSEQVVELHRAGMEIGGHTVHHPILRVLDDAEAEAEITAGRMCLQALIGAPVDVFAYPNGRPMQDYDLRHVQMVRKLGFRCAVSTANGLSGPADDRFQLPRFTPWDRSPARWMGRLLAQRCRPSRPELATA